MNLLISFIVISSLYSNVELSFIPSSPDIIESSFVLSEDKRDLEYAIEEALNYIKKAINSDKLSDLSYYARKAKNESSRAINEADDLDLDDAETECREAYRYCRSAEDERDFKCAIEYLKKARTALQNAARLL